MPRFILGVDGGGAHTTVCLLDAESGAAIEQSFPESANPNVAGLDAACSTIERAARLVLSERPAARIETVVCCLSGAGRPAIQEAIRDNLLDRGLAKRVIATHDAEAVLASAHVFGAGIAVLAGTGSFVWGRDAEGRVERADGWGSLLGDESGGFAIGQQALRAVCRHADERGPETRLTKAALEHYGVDAPAGLIEILATPAIPRDAIAGFAPRVFRAADQMDAEAVRVIERAAQALTRSALSVRRRLFAADAPATFVLGGKIARLAPLFQSRFISALEHAHPAHDTILCPEDSLALGAARLGLENPSALASAPPTEIILSTTKPDAPELSDSRRVFEECATLATEQRNPRAEEIDLAPTIDIVRLMCLEDAGVAPAVEREAPRIAEAVDRVVETFRGGGRLFYMGAGTSGRLGCLDAAECPPTFGTPSEMVQGVLAGGAATLLRSREGAEDKTETAAHDLASHEFDKNDMLVGLAASRRTPYVLAGLEYAKRLGATTALVTCSPSDKPMENVDILIAPLVGPEVVMGSTRLKAATAQKMILNMLTTAAMIRLGKVYRGMMVDLQMSCGKLAERAKRTVMMVDHVDYEKATELLVDSGGSVKRALVMGAGSCTARQADEALERAGGQVRAAIAALKGNEK